MSLPAPSDPPIHLGFAPDRARAAALDRRMVLDLAGSLDHLHEAIDGRLDSAPLVATAARLRAGGEATPQLFGLYHDLVEALIEGRLDDAPALIQELAELPSSVRSPVSAVTVLEPALLGRAFDRYLAAMNEDEGGGILIAPSAATVERFGAELAEGMDLLARALPALKSEIDVLVRDIVIVESDPAAPMQFDGGSHHRLWGALFLNGAWRRDPVAIVELLAHEAAHCLLFGFCPDEPLVENDPEDLYTSPLRLDPRPMEGIYHATFVSARMHWAMTNLAASGLLTDGQRAAAEAAAAADRRNFEEGQRIVRAHGLLTPMGAEILAGAAAWLDASP